MKKINLKGKVAVISGGMGYVGQEVALQFVKAGIKVALIYNNTTKKEIDIFLKKLGNGSQAYKCDLAEINQVNSVLNKIEKEMDQIYLCIHTAGIKPIRKQIHLTSKSELDSQMSGAFVSAFNFLSVCTQKLKQNKCGVILAITTIGVLIPGATRSLGAYIPAKFALQGMLTMLKDELSPYNIRVYSVAPGFMDGGMNKDIPQAFKEIIIKNSITKKITSAKEVAKKILTICENQNENRLTMPISPEYGLI